MRAADWPAEQAHLFGLDVDGYGCRRWARTLTNEQAAEMVQRFAVRCVQQAFEEALPVYWIRRAQELERVGTPWADATAVACRRHAWILATTGMPGDIAEAVDVSQEVA